MSFESLLPDNRCGGRDSSDGAGNSSGSRPRRSPVESSGAESGDGAVDQVIPAPEVDHGALEARKDEAQHAERVPEPATTLTPRVQDPVEPELEGVAGLGGPEAFEGTLGAADDGAGEVAGAGVVLEVIAP